MRKENYSYTNLPHTIFEAVRESLSTTQEKTEEEIYYIQEPLPKKNILSGQWINMENEDHIAWFPNREKMSLLEYTNPETLEFYLEYSGELTSCKDLFHGGRAYYVLLSSITSIPDTSKVTNMEGMFLECSDMTSLNLRGINTSNVTNMYGMFMGCSGLKSIDVSGFNTSKVTNMGNMFGWCGSLESLDLSSLDTSEATNMSNMFINCYKLRFIDGLQGFDTSKVTDMVYMFFNCRGLESIDLSSFNTSGVTTDGGFVGMFRGCESLKSLDLSNFDITKTLWLDEIFQGCSSLETLNLGGWDFSRIEDFEPSGEAFQGCASLTTILGPISGIKIDIDFSDCPLTQESALVILEGLSDEVPGKTITFSQETYNSLNPLVISVAEGKGWVINGK